MKVYLYGQDPLFEAPDDGNLTLQATSPCLNTGSELLYDTDVYGAEDLAGKYRIIAHIDMGAYEYNTHPHVETSNFPFVLMYTMLFFSEEIICMEFSAAPK